MVEMHREGSASADCAEGLYFFMFLKSFYFLQLPRLEGLPTLAAVINMSLYICLKHLLHKVRGCSHETSQDPPNFLLTLLQSTWSTEFPVCEILVGED